MNHENKRLSLFIIGLLLILGIGAFLTYSRDQDFRAGVVNDLGHTVSVTAAAIDPSVLELLGAVPDDVKLKEYERLRAQLADITQAYEDIGLRGLYIMKIDKDRVRFYVDSAPVDDPWHSEPGVEYKEYPSAIIEVAREGDLRFTGPYTDEYGTFYSVFVTIKSPQGAVPPVVGADIEAASYDQRLIALRMPLVLLTFFAVLIYTAGFFVITHRQKLLRIKRYSDWLETIIERMPIGVMVIRGDDDMPGIINAVAVKMLGGKSKVYGKKKNFSEMFRIVRSDGSRYPSGELPISIARSTGQMAMKDDVYIKQMDGSRIAVRMSCSPIKDEGVSAVGMIVVMENMTAEYLQERQKTDFISVASHELRTPLTGLKWSLEQLLGVEINNLSSVQKRAINDIRRITEHLSDLTDGLLNLAQLESGKVNVEHKETDINEVIDNAIGEIRSNCEKKCVKISFRPAEIPNLYTDAKLIGQIVINLLSNAMKFTPKDGKISIFTERNNKFFRIAISDTGIGIPLSQKELVFKRYFRADNAIKRHIEGTGLGLAICRNIADLLGATLRFSSGENKGSTFWFTIPLSGNQKSKKKLTDKTVL
jgi:signal transduction histidine kinase